MKRLLDADEPVPGARNSTDVDIVRILPDHIDDIARESLEVLLTMAQTQFWWLQRLQEHQGRLIVEHTEWHATMRPIVQAAFAEARPSDPALVLEFRRVPWPLVMAHWVRWNAWLHARPAPDAAPSDYAAWIAAFHLMDHQVAGGRAWTWRRNSLVRTLLEQADMLFKDDAYNVAPHVIDAVAIELFGLLEVAVRVHWKAGRRELVKILLEHIFNGGQQRRTDLITISTRVQDVAPAIYSSLQNSLPRLFLDVNLPTDLASRIYACYPDQSLTRDLDTAFELRSILPMVITEGYTSVSVCARVGLAAAWRLGAMSEGEEGELNDLWIYPLLARRLFSGAWSAYWDKVIPAIATFAL